MESTQELRGAAQKPKRTMKEFLAWLFTKRRRYAQPAHFIEDEVALRNAIFLCDDCSKRMGGKRWRITAQYRPMSLYGGQGLCDYCQDACRGTLWLPEDGGMWQEIEQVNAVETASRKQAIAFSDRRRVRLA